MTKPPPVIEKLRAAVGSRPMRRAPFYAWLRDNPRGAAVIASAPGRRKGWAAIFKALPPEARKNANGGDLKGAQAAVTWFRFWKDRTEAERAAILATLEDRTSPPPEAAPAAPAQPTTAASPTRRRFARAGDPGADA